MPFPVDWTDLIADEHRARTQSLYSRNGDVYLIIHHAYNYTVDQTIATFKSPVRSVSANFALGPKVPGVTSPIYCVRTVAEHNRAYTTASSYDDRALTVETSNINLNDPFPVAQAAKQRLAQLAAYMHTEYKMPLDRWHVTSHQEVYKRGWGSYATSCPGGDLQGALDWIVAEAKRIVAGGGTSTKETKVKHTYWADRQGRSVAPGQEIYLQNSKKQNQNVVGAPGPYSLTAHVYAEGQAGDKVDVQYIWINATVAEGTPGKYSGHYVETLELDSKGQIKASREFKRAVASGWAVFLKVKAHGDNKAAVKISVLDSDAYQFIAA